LTSNYKLAETNEALHVKPINGRRFANETILGPVHEIEKKISFVLKRQIRTN
jgi:hypothetical protein